MAEERVGMLTVRFISLGYSPDLRLVMVAEERQSLQAKSNCRAD